MKKSILFISAAVLLLAGCQQDQLVNDRAYTGPVTVVGATFENLSDGATKASVDDNGIFSWQDVDKASFAQSSESASYVAGNKATGTPDLFEIGGSFNPSVSSFAVYPSDLTTGQTPGTLKVNVPTSRVWTAGQTNVAMYGVYDTEHSVFNFKHIGGLLRIRVKNVPTNARSFVFDAKGYKITGVFDVQASGDAKYIATSQSSSDSTYTLTWATAPETNNTMDFYVPLPAGNYGNGFTFSFKDSDGQVIYSKSKASAMKVERRELHIMQTITLTGGALEPADKAATVEKIPAGYTGDYLLPQSEKVILQIDASGTEEEDDYINLKYYGSEQLPAQLEIQIVGGDKYDALISGELPNTHVDITLGEIAATALKTSSSTLAVISPAEVGTLTVKGGNVVLKGATVDKIVVDEGAVADAETNAPVQIVMEKVGDNAPSVTSGITANADVIVAPKEETIEVQVTPAVNVNVATEGAGTVKDSEGASIANGAAQIGDIKYATLADAIAKVADGDTIKMLGDVAKANGISVPSGKNFTVDFGGHIYTGLDNPAGSTGTTNQVFQLLQGSTITFKNGTINLATTYQNKFRFLIQNYANLTLDDMTLDGTNLAITDRDRYTISNNCGTVEFKGATTINAAAERGIAFDVCKYMDYSAPTVTWNSTGTVTGGIELSGGKFVVATDLAVDRPIVAIDDKDKPSVSSTLTINSGATISTASTFQDHTPGISGYGVTGLVQVRRGADLTINGAGSIEAGNQTYSAVMVTVNNDNAEKIAKLTVNDQVTITGDYYGIVGNGKRHNTNITVNGGTIKGTHDNDNHGIYHPQNGSLTINGESTQIIGYNNGIEMRAGNLVVNNGTIIGTATNTTVVSNGNGSTTKGAGIAIAPHTTGKDISVTINGGEIKGNQAISNANPQNQTSEVAVTVNGGTFSDLSGLKYVADNATYTLGANVDNAAGMSLDTKKTFTVDFNNHTYTVNKPGAGSTNTQTSAFQLLEDQTITFKNGKIQAAEANLTATADDGKSPIKRFIQNYANLTLSNMTLDGTNINDNYSVVEFCNGTVTINGSTNFTAKSGVASINVDSWKGSYPNGTAVTINTTGNVGKIHCYTEGTGSMTTKSSLTIKNGKNITLDDVSNGEVVISIEGGEFTDESAIKYAAQDAEINIALQANRNASGIFLGPNKNVKVTFDLGGKTLNFVTPAVGSTGTENQAFHIEQGNQLFTLKNGKVTIDESAKTTFRFIIQNYADLTLEDVTIDGTGLSYNMDGKNYTYALSNNCGTVNLNGTTSIKASTTSGMNNYAFDVCKYALYDAPTVTWNSTGSVDGIIELSGGTLELNADLCVNAPVYVTSSNKSTLNLNGKNLYNTSDIWEQDSDQEWGELIRVEGGKLEINATQNGSVAAKVNDCYAVNVRENGELTINNGTFKGNCSAVQVVTGTATIEGGSFEQQQDTKYDKYVLNCIDANYQARTAKIIVKGGSFKGFDPANSAGENPQASFVAEGYTSTENNGVWTVSKQN